MRASSVSVAARLLLTTSLCLAGSSIWLTPAEAQFVCVGSNDGLAPFDAAGATATGSPNNFACGQNANASGNDSFNTAVGPRSNASGSDIPGPAGSRAANTTVGLDSNASGNGSFNAAFGTHSIASGVHQQEFGLWR